ncbi:hypothetical protein RSgd_3249 [Ralstonia solanacearum]
MLNLSVPTTDRQQEVGRYYDRRRCAAIARVNNAKFFGKAQGFFLGKQRELLPNIHHFFGEI